MEAQNIREETCREKTRRKFDRDAPVYEQTSDGQFCSRAYPAVVRKIGEAPFTSLLDVGCGTGAVLSSLSTTAKLYGIDLSAQMIACAKEKLGEKAELTVGDSEALPFSDAAFDTVCCTFSFHHYPNPEKVIAEMSRVLKNGGRLLLADPWVPAPLRQVFNFFLRYSNNGDYHCYSQKEMRRLLGKNGFERLEFTHPTHDSFLLAARKAANRGGARNDQTL